MQVLNITSKKFYIFLKIANVHTLKNFYLTGYLNPGYADELH